MFLIMVLGLCRSFLNSFSYTKEAWTAWNEEKQRRLELRVQVPSSFDVSKVMQENNVDIASDQSDQELNDSKATILESELSHIIRTEPLPAAIDSFEFSIVHPASIVVDTSQVQANPVRQEVASVIATVISELSGEAVSETTTARVDPPQLSDSQAHKFEPLESDTETKVLSASLPPVSSITTPTSQSLIRSDAGSTPALVETTADSGIGHPSISNSSETAATQLQSPKLVVFAGGEGFNSTAALLRSMSSLHVSYILPVSDNGGSTSEILRFFEGPAIGDIRSRNSYLFP